MIFFYIIIIFMVLDLLTNNDKTKKKLTILLMVILTLLSMLRDKSVGSDINMFCSAFLIMDKLSIPECLETRYEFLNILLFKTIMIFCKDEQALLIVSSIIINFIIYKFIIRNSKNPLTTAILYFTLNYYFVFLCLMRQALALVMILIGYEMLKKDRNKLFCICILLACLFHTSAIIFLILLPLKKINKNVNVMLVVIPFSILGFLMGENLLTISTNIISDYSKYLDSSYIDSSYVTAGLYTLTSLIFLIFGLFVPSKKAIEEEYKNDANYNLLKWIITIGTIVSAISIKISLFSRIYIYFGFFSIIWLSKAIHLLTKKNNLWVWKFIIYLFTMLYVLIISQYDWYGIFPYDFFWN